MIFAMMLIAVELSIQFILDVNMISLKGVSFAYCTVGVVLGELPIMIMLCVM